MNNTAKKAESMTVAELGRALKRAIRMRDIATEAALLRELRKRGRQ